MLYTVLVGVFIRVKRFCLNNTPMSSEIVSPLTLSVESSVVTFQICWEMVQIYEPLIKNIKPLFWSPQDKICWNYINIIYKYLGRSSHIPPKRFDRFIWLCVHLIGLRIGYLFFYASRWSGPLYIILFIFQTIF